MSRESYGGGGQYGSSSSSSNSSSGGGGGRDASQPDFSPPSTNNPYSGGVGGVQIGLTTPPAPPNTVTGDDSTKTKLDYITSPEYRDLFNNLSTDRQEDVLERLDEQKKQAIYSISPMTDPKNKAIALGLNLLVPGLGGLYGTYKTQTAMGYSIQNPFEGIFEGGEPTLEDISNLRDGGGDNRDIQTQVISQAPFAITQTEATPSIVNEYFANLNIGQQASSDLQTRYNSAKSNITNILNLKSVEDQFGYVAQPNLLNLNLKGLI